MERSRFAYSFFVKVWYFLNFPEKKLSTLPWLSQNARMHLYALSHRIKPLCLFVPLCLRGEKWLTTKAQSLARFRGIVKNKILAPGILFINCGNGIKDILFTAR